MHVPAKGRRVTRWRDIICFPLRWRRRRRRRPPRGRRRSRSCLVVGAPLPPPPAARCLGQKTAHASRCPRSVRRNAMPASPAPARLLTVPVTTQGAYAYAVVAGEQPAHTYAFISLGHRRLLSGLRKDVQYYTIACSESSKLE